MEKPICCSMWLIPKKKHITMEKKGQVSKPCKCMDAHSFLLCFLRFHCYLLHESQHYTASKILVESILQSLYGSMTLVEKRLAFSKSKSNDRLHGIHELNPRFGFSTLPIYIYIYIYIYIQFIT